MAVAPYEIADTTPGIAGTGTQDKATWRTWLVLSAILVIAVLRVHGFNEWPLRGDEPWTFREGELVRDHGPFVDHVEKYHPSYFWVIGAIFKATGSATIMLARLPAVIAGILTFPIFWWLGRRAFGRHIALIALLVIVFSEWHLGHAKQARFYSIVFLLSGMSMLLLYIAVWERRPRLALASIACALIGISFHATAASAILGGCAYLTLLGLVPRLRPQHPMLKTALWYLVPLMAASLPEIIVMLALSKVWVGYGIQWNYTPAHMVLGLIRTIGLSVVVAATIGAAALLWMRPRIGVLLICSIVPTIIALMAVSTSVDVRPDFAFAVMPAIAFLAAAACVLTAEQAATSSGKLLLMIVFTALIIVPGFPSMVSHFTEKKNDDPRLPSAFITARMLPDDEIICYMSGVEPYHGKKTYRLGDMYSCSAKWDEGLQKVKEAGHRTWFVLSYPRAGLPKKLDNWLSDNASLLRRWRAERLDYLTRDTEVWLYDPQWPERQVRKSELRPLK